MQKIVVMKHPCEQCIVLAICRVEVKKARTVTSLLSKCSALSKYLYSLPHMVYHTKVNELRLFYNLESMNDATVVFRRE